MKKFIAIAVFASIGFAANAQNQNNQTSSASQTTNLVSEQRYRNYFHR